MTYCSGQVRKNITMKKHESLRNWISKSCDNAQDCIGTENKEISGGAFLFHRIPVIYSIFCMRFQEIQIYSEK